MSQAPDIAPKDGKVSSYIYLTCLIFRFFFSVRSLKNNPGRSTPGCSHASGSPGYKRDGKKDGVYHLRDFESVEDDFARPMTVDPELI